MEDLPALHDAMEAAAARLDFEEARRLRDRISLLRAADPDVAPDTVIDDADVALLRRQQPGAMGLGSSTPRPSRPEAWTPPPRPDLMTNRPPRGRRGR